MSARLVNGRGGLFSLGEMVCHCLLIETGDKLILVDTGLGSQDLNHPEGLGHIFRTVIRPRLSMAETAAEQVRRLGFSTDDVRHIVLTHLDLDHAGGLPDFPHAEVHVSGPEHGAAMAARSFRDRFRYHPSHWAHSPKWKTHAVDGEKWFGFEAVRAIDNAETEVLLVPLRGHTEGHCGVAVKVSDKWVLDCGDAYFFNAEMSLDKPSCTLGLSMYQGLMQSDHKARVHNQFRLRELKQNHGNEIRMFCSHDHSELCKCQVGAPL